MAYSFRSEIHHWNPNCITEKGEFGFALIILQNALVKLDSHKLETFKRFWKSATYRVVVDGAANELIDIGLSFIPDCVSGSFQVIKTSTMNHFKGLDVEIVETPDHDYTDFLKALLVLNDKKNTDGLKIDYVITLYQVTHRMDESFALIDSAYRWNRMESPFPIFFVDLNGTLSFLLAKGRHQITKNFNTEWCSLAPFDGISTVTTTGLVHNLNKSVLSFESTISTSNKFDKSGDKVAVTVDDKPVFWSQHYVCP